MNLRFYFVIFTVLTSLFYSSCNNTKQTQIDEEPVPSFALNDTIKLDIHQLNICENESQLFITYDSLVRESRCPRGSNCFWEGDAVGKFNISFGKELETIYLNTNKPENIVERFNFSFELINLTPYPGEQNEENSSKSAILVISKPN